MTTIRTAALLSLAFFTLLGAAQAGIIVTCNSDEGCEGTLLNANGTTPIDLKKGQSLIVGDDDTFVEVDGNWTYTFPPTSGDD